jgi:hypothetical protein
MIIIYEQRRLVSTVREKRLEALRGKKIACNNPALHLD